MAERAAETEAKPRSRGWRHELKQFALLALLVLGVHSFIGKPFYIPSESMLPTLLVGDRLIVSKFPYGYSYQSLSIPILPPIEGRLFGDLPERGDVVVIKAPGARVDFIKRVIGLPGDTVEIRDGQLILNGEPVRRTPVGPLELPLDSVSGCGFGRTEIVPDTSGEGGGACRAAAYRETLPNGRSYLTLDIDPDGPLDDFGPVRVPPGHLFLMGDNRDNSADSRVRAAAGGLGLLPVENLEGRAEFITFSLAGSARLLDPSTWPTAFRSGRTGLSLHADRER